MKRKVTFSSMISCPYDEVTQNSVIDGNRGCMNCPFRCKIAVPGMNTYFICSLMQNSEYFCSIGCVKVELLTNMRKR